MGFNGLWSAGSLSFGADAVQALSGDNNTAIYADSNNSIVTRMILRDKEDLIY